MKIHVLSRKCAKIFRCPTPWAAISIATEAGTWPELHTENRVGLLRLAFGDVEFAGRDGGITTEDAGQILKFVLRWQDEVDCLLVHCEGGVSRSPAVAAAVFKVLTGQDADYLFERYTPNMLVYRTIVECGSIRGH